MRRLDVTAALRGKDDYYQRVSDYSVACALHGGIAARTLDSRLRRRGLARACHRRDAIDVCDPRRSASVPGPRSDSLGVASSTGADLADNGRPAQARQSVADRVYRGHRGIPCADRLWILIRTLATDVRGAAGLVIGIFLLPFIALASLGLVVFEWARGWSARTIVPASDRALLTSAAIAGALLAIVPAVSSALFPIHSLTRSQYSGILPWIVFALGLGVLIVRGLRGNQFPASATYSTTLAAYVVGAAVLTVLNVLDYRGGFGVTLLVQGKGLLVNGAGFALVLAVVPAGALAILDRLGPDRSGSWVMRALLAVPLVLTVAWLGVSAGTTALRPRQAREFVLSDEQLSGQAKHLQKRCSEAGTHVLSTRSDVTELEIRFPDEPLRKTPAARLRIHPDATRPHHWFPMQGRKPAYERVVFVENGKRTGYGLDAAQSHGYGYVGAEDTYPRYVLTWKSLQTPDEEVDGVVGNEMTIIDTQNNSVLARRVLFFRRTNEHFGVFQEACGTLGQKYIPDAYAYDWATTILIPKSTFANK